MKKIVAPFAFALLIILAVGGCSGLPQGSNTRSYSSNQRIEVRSISTSDLAKIQSIAAESAEAVSQMEVSRDTTLSP